MSDKSKDLPAHECFLLKRAEHAFKPTKGAGLTFGLFWCGNFTIIKSLSLLGCAIWEANIKIKTILKVVVVQRYYQTCFTCVATSKNSAPLNLGYTFHLVFNLVNLIF